MRVYYEIYVALKKLLLFKEVEFPMPERKTKMAAGYDICLPQDVTIKAHTLQMCDRRKSYMQDDEFLGVHIRSSMAVKKGLALVNNVGIIDADYYNNEDNEGHIMLGMYNTTDSDVTLAKGERVAQGIFYKYLRLMATAPTQPAAAASAAAFCLASSASRYSISFFTSMRGKRLRPCAHGIRPDGLPGRIAQVAQTSCSAILGAVLGR